MYGPAATVFRTHRTVAPLRALVVLWLIIFAVAALFPLLIWSQWWRPTIAAIFAIVSMAAILGGRRMSIQGEFSWDGSTLGFNGEKYFNDCEVSIPVDFQTLLLVKLTARDGRKCWIWLERQKSYSQWIAVRRVLYFCSAASQRVALKAELAPPNGVKVFDSLH